MTSPDRTPKGPIKGRGPRRVARDYLAGVQQKWEEVLPDLDTSPLGVFGRSKRLAEIIERAIAPLFQEHGLRGGEFEVLTTLRRCGPPFEMSPGDLSRVAVVTPGAVTKRVDNLERASLVRRRPHPVDRRALIVGLTPGGVQLVDDLLPLVIERVRELLDPVRETQETLAALLSEALVGVEGEYVLPE